MELPLDPGVGAVWTLRGPECRARQFGRHRRATGGGRGDTDLASCICHELQLDDCWPAWGHEAPSTHPSL